MIFSPHPHLRPDSPPHRVIWAGSNAEAAMAAAASVAHGSVARSSPNQCPRSSAKFASPPPPPLLTFLFAFQMPRRAECRGVLRFALTALRVCQPIPTVSPSRRANAFVLFTIPFVCGQLLRCDAMRCVAMLRRMPALCHRERPSPLHSTMQCNALLVVSLSRIEISALSAPRFLALSKTHEARGSQWYVVGSSSVARRSHPRACAVAAAALFPAVRSLVTN